MWRVGVLFLIGCGRIGFDEAVDATSSPDAPVFIQDCVRGPGVESFEGPMACEPFGSPSAIRGATLTQMFGSVVIDPGTTMDGYAGCSSLVLVDFSQGGSYQIVATTNPGAPSAYVVTHFYFSGDDFAFLIEDGVLYARYGQAGVYSTVGSIPYDPIANRYVRWRPQGAQVIAESARDSRVWTQIGAVTASAPASVRPDFGAGTNAPEPDPGVAQIGGFNTCAGS